MGTTIEKLLMIEKNKFAYPDFYGIEIKTKRKNDEHHYIGLFNSKPLGGNLYSIVNKYGYPDKILKDKNIIHHSSFSNKKSKLGLNYKTELFVNRENNTLHMLILDRRNIIEDYSLYWRLDDLYEKLINKCEFLAVIEADNKFFRSTEYFKYTNLNFYNLRSFNAFIHTLEKGYICITIKIGVFRKGPRKGQHHNHGITFQIDKNHMEKLFKPLN